MAAGKAWTVTEGGGPVVACAVHAGSDVRAEVLRHLAVRRRQRFALVYLDVDGLKRVNDSKGHGAGDLALKELAAVLRRSLRKRDFAARLGGDEFALLLPGAESATATGIAEKVLSGLGDAMPADHRIGASIGIVPDAQRFTTTEAVRKADTAMYASKTAGGSRITVAEV